MFKYNPTKDVLEFEPLYIIIIYFRHSSETAVQHRLDYIMYLCIYYII